MTEQNSEAIEQIAKWLYGQYGKSAYVHPWETLSGIKKKQYLDDASVIYYLKDSSVRDLV